MADSWRLARSLEVLRDEIRALNPGTTVWTIGDQAHASGWSDHNPTSSGVVCAIDVLGDKGLDLRAFADHLKRTNHKAVKYVIFDRRIWSKARDSEGWRYYGGSNPHTTHVHVSVGVGPDGRSTGPYDDTSPWGVALSGGGSLPSSGSTLREGDSGPAVEQLQRDLNEALSLGLVEDGDFGPNTKSGVIALQRTAGITEDGIYGPVSADALTDLLEDDMDLDDKINLRWDGEVKYSAKTTTVGGILTSTNYYTLQARDRILTELSAAKKRDTAILAAVEGLDTEAILARIDQRAAEDAQRDAELATLVEAAQSGRLEANEVVDEIAKRLGIGA